MTPLLEASDLAAGYNGVPVVRDLNLYLSAGEIVLLAGPNGAGKTTTCRVLTGALPALSGTLKVDAHVSRKPIHSRVQSGLGFLPESRAIFSSLTVNENLRLGRGPIEAAISHFPELERLLPVSAGLLSGGEQQMLALGRTLAADPRVIIVDEMSLGLAPMIVTRLLSALRKSAQNGVGVLLVEQHLDLALAAVDRAIFLKRGRIELEGRAADLRSNRGAITELYL